MKKIMLLYPAMFGDQSVARLDHSWSEKPWHSCTSSRERRHRSTPFRTTGHGRRHPSVLLEQHRNSKAKPDGRREPCPKACRQKTWELMPALRSNKLQKLAKPKDKKDVNMDGSESLLAEMKRLQSCLPEISVNQQHQKRSSSSSSTKNQYLH